MVAAMNELKECPFCGGEARYDVVHGAHSGTFHYVSCSDGVCAAAHGNSAMSKAAAVAAWNRRATDESIKEAAVALNLVAMYLGNQQRDSTAELLLARVRAVYDLLMQPTTGEKE